jgi:hypothetical protein
MRPPDFSVIACLLSIVLTGCGVAGRTNRPLRLTLPLRYVEQSNLTIRMDNRRFTRLANGCSKKRSIVMVTWLRCFSSITTSAARIQHCA